MPTGERSRIGYVFAAIAVGIIAWIWWSVVRIDSGENLSLVDWLPDTASRISFHRETSWTAFECDMSEEDFVKFAEKRNYRLKEIADTEVIERYGWMDVQAKRATFTDEGYRKAIESQMARVDQGLASQRILENGGGYHIVFDRKTQRVYFQGSSW